MCRTAEDCAIVLDAIMGSDDRDLAVTDKAFNWHGGRSRSGLRI